MAGLWEMVFDCVDYLTSVEAESARPVCAAPRALSKFIGIVVARFREA